MTDRALGPITPRGARTPLCTSRSAGHSVHPTRVLLGGNGPADAWSPEVGASATWDNATLFNAQGQQFSADGEAAIYLEDSSSLYEEINPGNTLASKVVFDVPAGTVPTSIELHDSAFSGGVTVDLQ